MKKIALMFFGLAAFVVSTTLAYAGSVPYVGYRTERSWKMTHDVGKMLGTYVTDRDGQKIAKVKDFVMDKEGRIAFAILGYSGDKGTEKLVAVPYAVLFYNELDKDFITNITKEHLASAPEIRDTADLGGHEYAGNVYRYFGLQPPWGNEESGAIMGE